MRTPWISLLVSILALAGCSPSDPPEPDGGPSPADTGPELDGGGTDAAPPDAPAPTDAGAPDAPMLPDAGVDPCAGGACDPCDTGLAIDAADPMDAARALGACSGVVAAAWELPSGSPPPTGSASFALGHGLLDGFGTAVTPREGARLLALSNGAARDRSDPGYVANLDKGYMHALPAGFPREAPRCGGVTPSSNAHDGIALHLTLDVPPGANGFRLLLKHHTHEWPSYACSPYTDEAAVLVSPAPAGAIDGNVALDGEGNPLSVNSNLIDVCACAGGPPCIAGGLTYACSAGAGELAGTGFDGGPGAATQWLELRVPAAAGARIEVRLVLWDSGDGILDGTTLFDGFRWITDAPADATLTAAP